jgi:hypothetical protein
MYGQLCLCTVHHITYWHLTHTYCFGLYLSQTAEAFCAEAMRGGTAQAMEGCVSGVGAAILDKLTPYVPQARSSTTSIDTADADADAAAAAASDEVNIYLLDIHNSSLYALSCPSVSTPLCCSSTHVRDCVGMQCAGS